MAEALPFIERGEPVVIQGLFTPLPSGGASGRAGGDGIGGDGNAAAASTAAATAAANDATAFPVPYKWSVDYLHRSGYRLGGR